MFNLFFCMSRHGHRPFVVSDELTSFGRRCHTFLPSNSSQASGSRQPSSPAPEICGFDFFCISHNQNQPNYSTDNIQTTIDLLKKKKKKQSEKLRGSGCFSGISARFSDPKWPFPPSLLWRSVPKQMRRDGSPWRGGVWICDLGHCSNTLAVSLT